MTKEEKIKEAYGEHWETVKDYVNIDGWFYLSETNFRLDNIMPFEFNGANMKMRPLSLKGIETFYTFEKIPNFEFYEVNKLGIVKSLARNTIQKNGKNYNVSEKTMTPQIDSHGYIVFGLRDNGKTIKTYLHRILAELFISNPENKPCVNHKDGVKYNNSLSNLEWCTYQENNVHAFDIGLQKRGKEHHLYGKKGIDCHNHKNYNRGWIKIESEKDLPKENGEYHIINSKNEMWRYNFDNNDRIKNCTWLTEITHYQPIVKPKPPIY